MGHHQRVPVPPEPRWFKFFHGPDWLPFHVIVKLLMPVGAGIVLGPGFPKGTGSIVVLFCLVLVAWQFVGWVSARAFARRWVRSDEAKAQLQAAHEAAQREEAINHQAFDWLTRVANEGSDSPFKDMGFDSTVGLLVVVRRDQRVPGHPDKWFVQTFFNTLPPQQALSFETAAHAIHKLSHELLAVHEQSIAGTVEVRT